MLMRKTKFFGLNFFIQKGSKSAKVLHFWKFFQKCRNLKNFVLNPIEANRYMIVVKHVLFI